MDGDSNSRQRVSGLGNFEMRLGNRLLDLLKL